MRLRFLASVGAFAALTAGAPRVARADDVREPLNTVSGHVGVFSAVGELGVSYTRDFSRYFEVEAGVGLGFTGIKLSLIPRLEFGSATRKIVTGAGPVYSFGISGNPFVGDGLWLNVDLVGYQERLASGWVFSTSAGFAHAGDERCPQFAPCTVVVRGTTLPQGRVGLGRSF